MVKDKKNDNEISALKIFEKQKVTRMRKHKDILMEKYVLQKLADCPDVVNLLETFKDDISVYMRLEAVEGGELWDICKHHL